jgi:hypothetical protein
VKGCKIWAYARRSGPLSREGSLSCHTCCETGPRFFRSHPKDLPIQLPLTTRMGMQRTYSNPDPHGAITQVKFKFGHGLMDFLQGLFLLEKCFVTALWLLFGCLYRVRIACLDAS